jgi:peptidoglycan hydrolase CwlO-like protein
MKEHKALEQVRTLKAKYQLELRDILGTFTFVNDHKNVDELVYDIVRAFKEQVEGIDLVDDLRGEIDDLEKEVDTLEKELTEKEDEIAELETDITELETDIEKLEEKIANLENKLDDRDTK